MSQRTALPSHLFLHWDLVEDRLRESQRILLFLDFDGTLVATQRNREVSLQNESRDILQMLAKNPRVTIVAISGRRRAELRRLVGVRGVQYFGLYGAENGSMPTFAPSVKKALFDAYSVIRNEFHEYPGIWLENKVGCFAIHFREAAAHSQGRILLQVRDLVSPFRSELHLIENLRDIEVAPRSMRGKGAAVRQILHSRLNRQAFAMYFGDDLSDEPAFLDLRAWAGEGVTVLVGHTRNTHAQFLLRSPKQVSEALSRIEEALG